MPEYVVQITSMEEENSFGFVLFQDNRCLKMLDGHASAVGAFQGAIKAAGDPKILRALVQLSTE